MSGERLQDHWSSGLNLDHGNTKVKNNTVDQ